MHSDSRGRSIEATELRATRRVFDRWRQSPERGRCIPPALWTRAGELARTHGVARTARVLGLEYYALAKRAGRPVVRRGGTDGGGSSTSAFVEVAMPTVRSQPRAPRCRLELSDDGGRRLYVEIDGAGASEIEAVARGLWSGTR